MAAAAPGDGAGARLQQPGNCSQHGTLAGNRSRRSVPRSRRHRPPRRSRANAAMVAVGNVQPFDDEAPSRAFGFHHAAGLGPDRPSITSGFDWISSGPSLSELFGPKLRTQHAIRYKPSPVPMLCSTSQDRFDIAPLSASSALRRTRPLRGCSTPQPASSSISRVGLAARCYRDLEQIAVRPQERRCAGRIHAGGRARAVCTILPLHSSRIALSCCRNASGREEGSKQRLTTLPCSVRQGRSRKPKSVFHDVGFSESCGPFRGGQTSWGFQRVISLALEPDLPPGSAYRNP